MEYNLSWLVQADRTSKGHRAYIRAGGAVLCAFLAIWILTKLITAPRSGEHEILFIEGLTAVLLLGFIGYMLVVSLPVFLPGAQSLTIDDDGVQLVYSRNRREVLRFDDSALRVTLWDFSSQPDWVHANYTYSVQRTRRLPILGPYYRRSLLSREAFDAVLAAARNRGLIVQSRQSREFSFNLGALVYEISGRAR